jgi:tRNA(fMet)-specific endonuclease VapC
VGRRLILDTAVLIDAERGRRHLTSVIVPDDDVAIAAITIAELWNGVERADKARRPGRAAFVKAAVSQLLVEDYTTDTALEHGRLLAHVSRVGKPRGAHDLIIAATAAATGRTVVSTDRAAHFADLPGVALLGA